VAFSDPQSITINAVAIPLNRVYTGTQDGLFVSADGNTRIELAPAGGSRTRKHRAVRLKQTKTTVDPLVGSTNIRVNDMWSLAINRPLEGYSDDECLLQLTGLIAWLTAGTNANAKKLIAGEN
jgi:hypothetical protein